MVRSFFLLEANRCIGLPIGDTHPLQAIFLSVAHYSVTVMATNLTIYLTHILFIKRPLKKKSSRYYCLG